MTKQAESKGNSEDLEPIGRRVDRVRQERGLTQAALAKASGIGRSHLSRQLRGERTFQPDQLERIAVVLEIQLGELIAGTDAEGLLAATAEADRMNRALTERLAHETAENEALRTRLDAIEMEKESLKVERDEARRSAEVPHEKLREFERELATLRRRPSQEDFDRLWAERDELMGQSASLEYELGESRRSCATLQLQVAGLQTALQKAHAQAETNFRAYEHWKSEAESRGAALKVGALTAAGIGLFKMLGSRDGDDYDDDV